MGAGAGRLFAVCLFACLALAPVSAQAVTPLVETASLQGEINTVTASYIGSATDRAAADHAAALVIVIDTPGGLMSAMDDITAKLLNSQVPVIAFVSPAGARAASAGLFVAESADVLAMAPGTNIGSAHPILSNGTAPTDVLGQKVLNDAVARVRNLASIHGRNADWAEKAVRESVNIGVEEAVRIKVADLQAKSLPDLLGMVDGRQLRRPHGGSVTLQTAGARVVEGSMSPLQELMHTLINPDLAYVLMLLAIFGLIAEVSSPGAILPGVVGVISAILALVSLASLPVNLAGAALILFAFLLFVADIKAPTHGVLTAGGVVALVLGSAFLIDTGPVGVGINPLLIAGAAVASLVLFGFVVRKAMSARSRQSYVGAEAMIGALGEARGPLNPSGTVFVAGALWQAKSDAGLIPSGSTIRVLGRDGLTLRVAQHEAVVVVAGAT